MLEQQTWVTVLVVAGAWLALMGYLRNIRQDIMAEVTQLGTRLETQITGVRTEAKTDNVTARTEAKADYARLETLIADSHTDLKTDIGRLDGRLVALESRVHDIAIRLPVAVTPAQPSAS